MQQHVALDIVVKKLAIIFYCVFKVFLLLNTILLAFSLYTMILYRNIVFVAIFLLFFTNFWVMMVFFFLLSMYIKLFLCMIQEEFSFHDRINESWLLSIIFFPLVSEEQEEDFLQYVSQQSFDEQQERIVNPPTTTDMEGVETRWKQVVKEVGIDRVEDKKQEPCLICANPYEFEYPCCKGWIELECCPVIYHKKCVLEWFHFNQKQNHEDKWTVSCPSCRHLFSFET